MAGHHAWGSSVLRVFAVPPGPDHRPAAIRLNHGKINHGYQFLDDKLSRVPVSYYGDTSGVDLAIRHHPRRLATPPQPLRIGVLGLGTGTLAAFGETGDATRFCEINPAVIRYSIGERPFFTYLTDSAATTGTVEGDARLSLERELATGRPGGFDVPVRAAFSSDSVPAICSLARPSPSIGGTCATTTRSSPSTSLTVFSTSGIWWARKRAVWTCCPCWSRSGIAQ